MHLLTCMDNVDAWMTGLDTHGTVCSSIGSSASLHRLYQFISYKCKLVAHEYAVYMYIIDQIHVHQKPIHVLYMCIRV